RCRGPWPTMQCRTTDGRRAAVPGRRAKSGHGYRSSSYLQDDVLELSHDRAARLEATEGRIQRQRDVGRQSRRRALRPAASQSRTDRCAPDKAHGLRRHHPDRHDEGARRQPVTEARELIIDVKGMTCDHCERSVAKALQSVPGVREVLEVSHADAEARVLAGPEATADRIERAVAKAGYGAHVKEQSKGAADVPAEIRTTGG